MSAAAAPIEGAGVPTGRRDRGVGTPERVDAEPPRDCWSGLLVFTKLIQPSYGPIPVQGLGTSVLPLALAAVAQAVIVISGGIDLSIGSMMALTSVVAASLMDEPDPTRPGSWSSLACWASVSCSEGSTAAVVVGTRVPDIVVTLAMSFVWAGFALLVRSSPGGGAASWLHGLAVGPLGNEWIPRAAVVLLVVVSVIWFPLRALEARAVACTRSAATGSPRSGAGFPSDGPRSLAYAITGLFAALGGLVPDRQHRDRDARSPDRTRC